MAATIQSTIYELNRGIQDILPFEASVLPDKVDLAPTDSSGDSLLHALYAARNYDTLIAAFLRPAVRNLENLRPDRYRRSLRRCRKSLQDADVPALAALASLLEEEEERAVLLFSFQGLLLNG